MMADFTNYFNIMITGFLARKKLSVMKYIGITERQKRKRIIVEGSYYCLFTAGLLLTMGMAILIPVRYYMEQRLAYIRFSWLIWEVMILNGGFIVINQVNAWVICRTKGCR